MLPLYEKKVISVFLYYDFKTFKMYLLLQKILRIWKVQEIQRTKLKLQMFSLFNISFC